MVRIRISERRASLGVGGTYRCTGAGTSNGVDLTTYHDLEVQLLSLSGDIWEPPTRSTVGQCVGVVD